MAKDAPLKNNIHLYMYIHIHEDPSQFSPLETPVYLIDFINGKTYAMKK